MTAFEYSYSDGCGVIELNADRQLSPQTVNRDNFLLTDICSNETVPLERVVYTPQNSKIRLYIGESPIYKRMYRVSAENVKGIDGSLYAVDMVQAVKSEKQSGFDEITLQSYVCCSGDKIVYSLFGNDDICIKIDISNSRGLPGNCNAAIWLKNITGRYELLDTVSVFINKDEITTIEYPVTNRRFFYGDTIEVTLF